MGNISRKLRKSKKGVSEIIGNILILGITVTLFSSIMIFVSQIPPPQENGYADFTPSVRYITGTPNQIEVNLTHKGGQELVSFNSAIFLIVNGTKITLHLSNSTNPLGDKWTVGEVFSYRYNVLPSDNPHLLSISVMITDTEKNSLLYSSNIVGGSAQTNSAPIIGARGMTPSPTYAGATFTFYAQIMDMDNDLRTNSVYINLSSIGLSASTKMNDLNSDGIYTVGPYTAQLAWNGLAVLINCSDWAGHPVSGQITLNILAQGGGGQTYYGPYYNYSAYLINGTYPPDVSGGESGGASGVGTTFYYIRRLSDMTITRQFTAGEGVMVEIYSDTLVNLALENSFFIYHPITGDAITPQSASTDAFDYGGIFSTFHRYVYNFSAPSGNYIYPIQMKAKDNIGTVVNILDTITVGGSTYPKLVTYKNVTNSLVSSVRFNHTDIVYLKIKTKDVDTSLTNVYVSDIEVSDYTGRYIIKKIPPAYSYPPLAYSAPVSCLHKTTTTPAVVTGAGGEYTIRINLRDAYQGWWLPRTNAYTIRIALFSDDGTPGTGEIYNQLSTQITVTAPLSTTDILSAVGSGSFTWSDSGAAWDNNAIKWYKGGEEWDETTIDGAPNDGPIAMALSDIDNDGDKDVVVGFQDSTYANLVWYENYQPDGKSWSSARAITMPFDARSGTQHRTGSTTDKTGTANEDSSVWVTQRSPDQFESGYYSIYELCGSLTVGDFDGDGDGDVAASFVHPVVYSDATGSGDADYTNSFGMYFNRGVYVFWNDGSWTRKAMHYSTAFLALNNDNMDTNPAAMDLDSADFNLDGYDDVVAVNEDGTTRVWLSQWGTITGDIATHENGAFGFASLKNISAYTGTGKTPWSHTQFIPNVRAADVNLDNYPDIVRTNTGDNSVTVYYTQHSTAGSLFYNATREYAYNGEGATRTNSMTQTQVSDNSYESLKEIYKFFSNVTAPPSMKSLFDTTLEDITKLAANDGQRYVVAPSANLGITLFDVPATYNGRTVESAKLKVMYTVTDKATGHLYPGTDAITWAPTDIGPFTSTGIVPKEGDVNKVAEFTIPVTSTFNTYDQIRSIDVHFSNSDTVEDVEFEYMVLEIKFVESRWEGWIWQIPNENRAYHDLSIECRKDGLTTENFRLAYSVDNSTWFNLTDVSAVSDTTYTFSLTPTTNDFYYVRVQDLDRSTADVLNDTFMVDRLFIRHWAVSVSWSTTTVGVDYYRYTFSLVAGNYLTGVAVGDMGRRASDYSPDTLPDIVVCTSYVVSSSTTGALYIMTQDTTSSFDVKPVYVSQLNTMCAVVGSYGSTGYREYDGKDVELGDTDGDGDLDIVLVVGAAIGTEPGSGPTLWHYQNDQRYSAGVWQYTEEYINVLATKGESAINVETGNIDLAILLPFMGIMGVIVGEAIIDRRRKR